MITTSYGTWCNRVDPYSLSVEQSVVEALGDYADDYDVEAIAADWRRAINEALPPGVSLVGNEFIGPAYPEANAFDGYPHDEYSVDIRAIVESVDFWSIAARHEIDAES